MKIVKYISNSGYCSRRKAEEIVLSEKVKVNGKIINPPFYLVKKTDILIINNKKIEIPKKTIITLLYKPPGIVTTHKDDKNRQSIFDILPKYMKSLIFIGRLDIQSEGLIILTNNKFYATQISNPNNKIKRVYKVKVFGKINLECMQKKLKNGIKINNFYYKKININLIKSKNKNHWLKLELIEGKNREIRNIMQYFNLKIAKLIRTNFGIFSLDNLKTGEYKKFILNHDEQFEI